MHTNTHASAPVCIEQTKLAVCGQWREIRNTIVLVGNARV